jgi:hypothetical protein
MPAKLKSTRKGAETGKLAAAPRGHELGATPLHNRPVGDEP